jgi:hypothetical protein
MSHEDGFGGAELVNALQPGNTITARYPIQEGEARTVRRSEADGEATN